MKNLRTILLFGALSILLFGCLGAPPAEPASPAQPAVPAENATPPTCLEHCKSLPHIMCVGEWNVSGTYPDCFCGFVCAEEEVPAGNDTAPADENPPEAGPLAEPTDKSASELMDDALGRSALDFYKAHDGSFAERTYKWERRVLAPGGLSYDLAPATDVRFDGQEIRSILASGFISFEDDSDGSEYASGVAVFNESSTMLDGYTGTDAFSIDYHQQIIDKKLRDCWVTTKDYNVDAAGGWLLVYYFSCETVTDK
jgi:hypothetical protein